MKPNLLPEDLLWADGGHASDVVLTALADGQTDIVPTKARTHVESCARCMNHLGNAALLSMHVDREMGHVRAAAIAAVRRPLPKLAIILGLLVAIAGIIPSYASDAAEARTFAHELPLLFNGLRTLAQRLLEPGSSSALVVTYVTAAALVLMALAIVRFLPKKEVSR